MQPRHGPLCGADHLARAVGDDAYWLAALPLQVWPRETEWTLRAPFALCTFLTGLAVLWLAGRILGPRPALICALAALTGGLVVQKLHRAEFDPPLALGVGVAILAASSNLAREPTVTALATGDAARC